MDYVRRFMADYTGLLFLFLLNHFVVFELFNALFERVSFFLNEFKFLIGDLKLILHNLKELCLTLKLSFKF